MSSARVPRPSVRGRIRSGPASVPVTVLSGFDRLTVDDLATGLLLRTERLAVVYGDPSTAERGYVTMTTTDGPGRVHEHQAELEHNCASCTLRNATIAELTRLAASGDHDALALHLHPGIEPDAALRGLLAELPRTARVDSHLTVLPSDWLDILAGGSSLTEHAAAITDDDDRFAATVLCAGIETATTIVQPLAPGLTSERTHDERAVLDLLAPAAVRLRLRSVLDVPDDDILATGRLDPARLDPLDPYGIRDPHRALNATSSLTLVRWHATRPLHPLRLHAALDQLADGVIRSSGRLDVADQPDAVVGWDSAGESLLLGPIAPNRKQPDRRRSALAFLGDDLDAAHIRSVLDHCLLTDQELAVVTSSLDDVSEVIAGWPGSAAPAEQDRQAGAERNDPDGERPSAPRQPTEASRQPTEHQQTRSGDNAA